MATIVTRAAKGSPLTHTEVDANFTNLNTDKIESGNTVAALTIQSATITGGTVNNTSIGGSTPAAGTFTTLTATVTSGTALAKVWSNTNTSPVADIELQRGTTSTWGGDAFTDYRIRATGGNFVLQSQNNTTSVLDLFTVDEANNALKFSPVGVEQMRVTRTASAVNYVQVTGAATSGTPVISAQGSDSNIPIELRSKGTSPVVLANGSGVWIFTATHSGVANRFNVTNSAAGISPTLTAGGSDTNVASTFISKGTGAINLAPGSSGVNISNGGTVTAITRTAAGSGYSTPPTIAISAPTTAGGVQATATCVLVISAAAIAGGGTGYTAGDVLTVSGGTFTTAAQITVSTVSGGVITAVTVSNAGNYTVAPSSPVSVTGGTGSGATFNLTVVIGSSFNITNAGSGYVEQPTVTFSGGGGSGAAAYATVGSGALIRALGTTGTQTIDFAGPGYITGSIPMLRLRDVASIDSYTMIAPNSGYSLITTQGNANGSLFLAANGTGRVSIQTSGTSQVEQFRVSHTASAVNYVQVTGSVTGQTAANLPSISVQGSDTNTFLGIGVKTTSGYIAFYAANNTGSQVFRVNGTNAANTANRVEVTAAASGSGPTISVQGGTSTADANIDLNLTTKGTGAVRFNTGGGEQARVLNVASANRYVEIQGGVSGSSAPGIGVGGGGEALDIYSSSNAIRFYTSGKAVASQFFVAHTASAVNYVQVTGAATGSSPKITSQGSDSNIELQLESKGASVIAFNTQSGKRQLEVYGGTATGANWIRITGSATTNPVSINALGTDTNIDLALTPKGTGLVRFGTRTATSDVAITGYIEIKDSGGTTRKLAIID